MLLFQILSKTINIGKELLTRSLYFDISRFGLEGGIWVLSTLVPGHCILVTFIQVLSRLLMLWPHLCYCNQIGIYLVESSSLLLHCIKLRFICST